MSEAIIRAIQQVDHPQINCSLVELGMVQDIQASEDGVSLKLVLPFLGIPTVVRDYRSRPWSGTTCFTVYNRQSPALTPN